MQTATDTPTIREAYDIIRGHNGDDWVAIATVQAVTGMRRDELVAAITEIAVKDDNFRAVPEVFPWRVTEEDRRYAVRIGGVDCHRMAWF